MARSEKQPNRRKAAPRENAFKAGIGQMGAVVAANPMLFGGVSAFAIAMTFVAANAAWHQPYAHSAPLFSTRASEHTPTFAHLPAEKSTTFVLARGDAPTPTVRPEAPKRVIARDPALERVQAILKDLGYYEGAVDGLSGPNTSAAITAYQRKVGLTPSGKVDKNLLTAMGVADVTGSIAREPVTDIFDEKQASAEQTTAPEPVAKVATEKKGNEAVRRIQAGLRSAGFETVSVDGLMGKRTVEAIKQFQTQNGMEPTGAADAALYVALQDLGLIETAKSVE